MKLDSVLLAFCVISLVRASPCTLTGEFYFEGTSGVNCFDYPSSLQSGNFYGSMKIFDKNDDCFAYASGVAASFEYCQLFKANGGRGVSVHFEATDAPLTLDVALFSERRVSIFVGGMTDCGECYNATGSSIPGVKVSARLVECGTSPFYACDQRYQNENLNILSCGFHSGKFSF
jgi:hypothetical protein